MRRRERADGWVAGEIYDDQADVFHYAGNANTPKAVSGAREESGSVGWLGKGIPYGAH